MIITSIATAMARVALQVISQQMHLHKEAAARHPASLRAETVAEAGLPAQAAT